MRIVINEVIIMIKNIVIGGTAGHGINTLSYFLVRILRDQGYHLHSMKDYMSRVRGGANFTQIRFGNQPIQSHDPKIDILMALNQEAVDLHSKRLRENGYLICDSDAHTDFNNVIRIPIKEIGANNQNPRGISSIAVGAITKVIGLDQENLKKISIPKWPEAMKEKNYNTALEAYKASTKIFDKIEVDSFSNKDMLYMSGNQAIALGAIAGGLDFYCAYPMAPSTGIMSTLSQFESKAGILVEQAEDEIAAMNVVIGASATGARSMTGSSGGGLALMVEALGFAGIGEVPIVAVDVQRPGPATGLPTRTEQSDLSFILSASQGEMPQMVLSVKSVEDAFYQSARALNIAETYRIPVLILSDQYLADMSQTFEEPDLDQLQIQENLDTQNDLNDLYKMYDLSGSLTPRMLPGQSGSTLTFTDSHEHDEFGHITEDAEIRTKMMHRRMYKLNLLKKDLIEPDYFGPNSAEIVLVGWGSMYGPLKDAVEHLNKHGHNVGALVFGDLFPLPEKKLRSYATTAKKLINVEMNYTGQLARLIRAETGIEMDESILKFDGRQLNFREIAEQVKELI